MGERVTSRACRNRRFQGSRFPALAALAVAAIAIMGWTAPARAEVCAHALAGTGWVPPTAVFGTEALEFEDLVSRLAQKRVVMIGEVHDRYEHHLNQLALICRLYRRYPNLAIGLEFFQQPFQDPLDAYVERRIDTAEMLLKTEYFSRWRFDYRLYAPILEFARAQGIPLLALNAPQEISSKVAREGLAGLSSTERAQIPQQLDRSVPGYRERLRAVFDQHPEIRHMSFENFIEGQLVWDETMANQAARYLEAHPESYLVVLERSRRKTGITCFALSRWSFSLGASSAFCSIQAAAASWFQTSAKTVRPETLEFWNKIKSLCSTGSLLRALPISS
jgi:uncharacterized iron-regulated protein